MISRWPHPFRLVVICVALAAALAAMALLVAIPTRAQSLFQAEEPVFTSQVEVAPLPSRTLPQDVAGVVLDRHGRGLPGVGVRIQSEGEWGASTATRGDGSFYFTITTEGGFSVRLVDRVSQPAFFRVDGKTAIRVVFQEVSPEATPTLTPTPLVTLVPTSPTPVTTLTPGIPTAGPLPTSPPPGPRGTPTPSVTPLSRLAPTPTASSSESSPTDPLATSFLAGIALAIAIFLGGMAVLRRRR